jgi:hypothetical protein
MLPTREARSSVRTMRRGDRINAVRRHVEQRLDQAWAIGSRRLRPPARVAPYDGDPRLALITVNRSTTRYLKLMLLTLAEQEELSILQRIVIVDNRSRDGADAFLDPLARAVPTVQLVRIRHFLNHARGIRAGLVALERAERGHPSERRTNLVLFCDPDVVFRKPDVLVTIASVLTVHDAAFVGELRRSQRRYPDVQASFLLVRRDWLARRDVRPWVNHGSPSLWLQESIWDAGGTVVDFPSNLGGHVLHRGRAAVGAAREHAPRSSYSTARAAPSYMGVPDGERIWSENEARWSEWLEPGCERALVERLAARFNSR